MLNKLSAFKRRLMASAWLCVAVSTNVMAEQCVVWGSGGRPFTDGTFQVRTLGQRFSGFDTTDSIFISEDKIELRPFAVRGVVHTGAVSTQNRFHMSSGVAKITANLCTVAPIRSAIWLQSPANNDKNGVQGAGAEIDVLESIGDKATHNLHFGGYGDLHETRGRRAREFKACQTSVYRTDFNESGFSFYIDDKLSWSDRRPHRSADEYFILGTEHDLRSSKKSFEQNQKSFGVFTVSRVEFCGNITLNKK